MTDQERGDPEPRDRPIKHRAERWVWEENRRMRKVINRVNAATYIHAESAATWPPPTEGDRYTEGYRAGQHALAVAIQTMLRAVK
jgi:hypothetical protein